MQTVDAEPIETLHVYVVREELPRPSLFPIVLSGLALLALFALCVLSPYRQPERRVLIRIPAVFLPLKAFTAQTLIIPTGMRVFPATIAHGILTITNGSVISQELPSGMIFTTNPTNVEVMTDAPVFVPAGNANGYGFATVSAHAVVSGTSGNIPTFAINHVIGSSIYIRNLQTFRGGRDAYYMKFATVQDKQQALSKVREVLENWTGVGLLAYPCIETSREQALRLVVDWTCQFYTFSVSSIVHVTHVKLVGKEVLVEGLILVRPLPFPGK